MKKKEISTYVALTLLSFAGMFGIAQNSGEEPAEILAEVESLSSSENDDIDKLTCHCSLIRSNNCATDNWGSECASGKNVHCWNYKRNCS